MRRYTRRKLLTITLVSAAANGIGFKTSIEPVTSPTPDASTDTGVVDAGTIDTAVGGNGIDAGTVDTGIVDTGVVDAGRHRSVC